METLLFFAALVLAQDKDAKKKEPTFAEIMTNTSKLKSYSFSISGSYDSFRGIVEKETFVFHAGEVEVAGKRVPTHARIQGRWDSYMAYLTAGGWDRRPGGMQFLRLGKLPSPIGIAVRIANAAQGVKGDAAGGFEGTLPKPFLSELCKESWIDRTDLPSSSTLRGRFKFTCQDALVCKVELQLQGRVAVRTAVNGPAAVVPGLKGGGQPYQYSEQDVTLKLEIEYTNLNNAKVDDYVKKVVGY